jgi:hypothetical protein
MQLSSPPAEELAKLLVDTSDGAFEQVAFLSGGIIMELCLNLTHLHHFRF